MSVERQFRGADMVMSVKRQAQITTPQIRVDGELINGRCLNNIQSGQRYEIEVLIANE